MGNSVESPFPFPTAAYAASNGVKERVSSAPVCAEQYRPMIAPAPDAKGAGMPHEGHSPSHGRAHFVSASWVARSPVLAPLIPSTAPSSRDLRVKSLRRVLSRVNTLTPAAKSWPPDEAHREYFRLNRARFPQRHRCRPPQSYRRSPATRRSSAASVCRRKPRRLPPLACPRQARSARSLDPPPPHD
jgi:hypothetical protein